MKKLLTYLFAGLLFVPTIAGCGGGAGEAETAEADDSTALPEGTNDADYGAQMEAGNQPPEGQ